MSKLIGQFIRISKEELNRLTWNADKQAKLSIEKLSPSNKQVFTHGDIIVLVGDLEKVRDKEDYVLIDQSGKIVNTHVPEPKSTASTRGNSPTYTSRSDNW